MELKDRIVEEASKLFFQHGIKSITMSDVANHLGISKRTLYEVFKDKDELLKDCLENNICKADKEMETLIEKSENVIDTMMLIYAKHLTDMHNINKSAIRELKKYHPQLYQIIENKQKEGIDTFIPLFERGVEQGLMRNDLNFEILLWLLQSQFKTLMEGDFIPLDKYSMDEFCRAIILTFTRGISTPQGNEKIDEFITKLNNRQDIKKN